MKKILKLDSHQLTAFQHCPQHFLFSYVLGIQPVQDKIAFKKGSAITKFLAAHYWRILRKKDRNLLKELSFLVQYIGKHFESPEKELLTVALTSYIVHYKDENWVPIAIEKGFSKIIYEDENHLFIYEGRPDLVVRIPPSPKLIAVDHKSRSQTYKLYPYNNQLLGYCDAIGTDTFVYNYLTLIKDPDRYERKVHYVTPAQITAWRNETIQWFFKILKAKEDNEFLRSLQCTTRFGECSYIHICEQPGEQMKLWEIHKSFKASAKRWKAW